ncbi:UNVERIFIED_CONTAM: protein EXORDIUM-like 3 [Sesamum latifolium]|uniref:Protein EXORDIUM-like 3 n=1 Tax=Sesamum latifolium TaxID=2727402 RepID=A0AAW2T8I2_9LAMI
MMMPPAQPLTAALSLAPLFFLLILFFFSGPVVCWRPWPNGQPNSTDFLFGGSKKYEGSSEFVKLKYHMGPVLTANITVYPIWYGKWQSSQKRIIREFIGSISAPDTKPPSVAGWWKTVRLYTDQTGANISGTVHIGEEKNDRFYSHGKSLTRLSVQSVIKSAVSASTRPLPVNPRVGCTSCSRPTTCTCRISATMCVASITSHSLPLSGTRYLTPGWVIPQSCAQACAPTRLPYPTTSPV